MQVGSFQSVSNREDWDEAGELRDENDALVDLTGATLTLGVADRETRRQVLSASTNDGKIVITGTGTFEWHIPVGNMRSLCAETYRVGLTIQINGGTKQLALGTLAVLDGATP